MLRNLGIRWQILGALVLPLLVLVALGGQIAREAVQEMNQAQDALDLSSTASSVGELVRALSNERQLTVSALPGGGTALDARGNSTALAARAELRTVRSANDLRIARISAEIGNSGLPARYQTVLTSSASGHAQLGALRASIDDGSTDQAAAVTRYAGIIAADVGMPAEIAARVQDRATADSFRRFAALGSAIEAQNQEQLTGELIASSGSATLEQQRQLAAAQALQNQSLADFDRAAPADEKSSLAAIVAPNSEGTRELDQVRSAFADAGTGAVTVDLKSWVAISDRRISALEPVLATVASDGVTQARQQLAAARLRAEVTGGGSLAVVLAVLLAAMLTARRISQPIRRLTEAATDIRDALPQLVEQVHAGQDVEIDRPAVAVKGRRNEVGRLAAAFVDVNNVTIQVAREQARLRAAVSDMFVNVARRNQVLLARQLSFIDQLERNEANPDSLEELFRLDHLATRMRRNAESLLVLAGIESGRRLREPMLLSDVIRTATSEIEHYGRVSLALASDPYVYAHRALPVAHLLAELLENATNFSDPASTVVVTASYPGSDSLGTVRITVADDGLGITPDELTEINERIENPPAADALGSQRLGFFVVGRIAQRLGAQVLLTSGRAGGTAVLIDLPGSIFVSPAGEIGAAPEQVAIGPDVADSEDSADSEAALALALAVPDGADELHFTDLITLHESDSGENDFVEPDIFVKPDYRVEPDLGAHELSPALTDLGTYQPESFLPPESFVPEPAPISLATDFFRRRPEPVFDDGVPLGEEPPHEGLLTEADFRSEEDFYAEPVVTAEPAPGLAGSSLFSGFRSVREPSPPSGWAPAPDPAPMYGGETVLLPPVPDPPVPDRAVPDRAVPYPVIPAPREANGDEARPARPEPVPWENFLERDVLPQKQSPGLRGVFRLGRRSAAPVHSEPAGSRLLGDDPQRVVREPRRPREPQAPPEPRELPDGVLGPVPMRRYRDDGQPRSTQWPSMTEPAGSGGADEWHEQHHQPGDAQGQGWSGPPVPVQGQPGASGWLSPDGRRHVSAAESFADLAAGPGPLPAGAASLPASAPAPVPTPAPDLAPDSAPSANPAAAGRIPDFAGELGAADRSHLASQALTELSRLSSYTPAAVQASPGDLQRRTPNPVPAEPEPAVQSSSQRARTASNVRSMLAGFKAGVERGRTSPSANRPVPRSRIGPQYRAREEGDRHA